MMKLEGIIRKTIIGGLISASSLFYSCSDGENSPFAFNIPEDTPQEEVVDENPKEQFPPEEGMPTQLGSKIAFSSNRKGIYQLFLMNTNGTEVTQITNTRSLKVTPKWSPDGNKIAFSALNLENNWNIYTINKDGTNETVLTTNSSIDGSPTWDPLGEKIAFVSYRNNEGTDIYLMYPDGSNIKRLTFTPDIEERYLDWSPDGTKIIFSGTTETDSIPYRENYIYQIDEDGNNLIKFSNLKHCYDPSWFPGGENIAYERSLTLFYMGKDGRFLGRLTNNEGHYSTPSWSPDGTKIAVTSGNEDSNPGRDIYILDTFNDRLINITKSPSDETEPDWSPF